MSLREEQCNKVCRILDDVLANRPTERDSLITAVRIAFSALNCSEFPNSSDTISRQAAIDAAQEWFDGLIVGSFNGLKKKLEAVPPAQPEIIYCKDCVKHNKGLGNYEVHPDGSSTWIWKDSACPLVSWRDKAQGHEFDYQFCAYAEKREVTT